MEKAIEFIVLFAISAFIGSGGFGLFGWKQSVFCKREKI